MGRRAGRAEPDVPARVVRQGARRRGLAGIFDRAVWPPFRRQGLGTALLSAVCRAAMQAGATRAVLNATPDGKLLYSSCGFTQIGVGDTWWWPAAAELTRLTPGPATGSRVGHRSPSGLDCRLVLIAGLSRPAAARLDGSILRSRYGDR
ncbi:GNAT family N-acetyltransferase [Nakamurella aerolata]|uniref:GNAT family N-acetyltransferase n=1 Tax=Nakamurella aerolata TaxID=1656892 RepID=A0A849A2T2_9ACTN|nr:GNAT family N-acetyltransferase [Nakamurella aerolata]